MKTIISILCILCPANVYSQWVKISSGTTTNLQSIYFKDSLTGFCAGGGNSYANPVSGTQSVILKTINSGAAWSIVYEDTSIALQRVIARGDTITSFGTGKTGEKILVQSIDNGINWIKDTISFSPVAAAYYSSDLYFLDTSLKKINQGVISDLLPGVRLFTINKNGEIFCIKYSMTPGADLAFARSATFGSSWDSSFLTIPVISSNSLSNASLKAFGDTLIFYATYPVAIAYSFDRGDSWNHFLAGPLAPSSGVYIISPQNIIGGQNTNKIMKSIDSGHTFYQQDTTIDNIKDFFFVNDQNGFLCGTNGIIYKTINGGSSVKENSELQKKISIYPNPASERLQIVCTQDIRIERVVLTDMKGNALRTTVGHATFLKTGYIPAGTYIIYLYTNMGIHTQKVEIIKL